MKGKTSTEVQSIFGISRDDIKRLQKDRVLKPDVKGQGIASLYGQEDMWRIFGVKMYLLAGYRLSDMKYMITDSYVPEKDIAEQIRIYRKRLQMLEFIRVIRDDLRKLESFQEDKLVKAGTAMAQAGNLPDFGTSAYFDAAWDILKLIFILDFLSQKESFREKQDIVKKRVKDGYGVLVKVLTMQGEEVQPEDMREILAELSRMSDAELQDFIEGLIEEHSGNRDSLVEEFVRECFEPIAESMDDEMGKAVRDAFNHMYGFAFDYFFDKESLYCICRNVRDCVDVLV